MRGEYAHPPYFDEDTIDVHVDSEMKTAYVFMRNHRGEPFFAQLTFDESMYFIYINNDGETISSFSRILAISYFFDKVKETAEYDIRDIEDNFKEELHWSLFKIKGKLSIEGSGAVVKGRLVHNEEFSLSFTLYTRFVAEEEYKKFLGSTKTANSSRESKAVDGMDGHAFEQFCAELLRDNGFTNVEVTPGSGDQGIDVLATKDFIKYGFQCKCYSADVGNKAVQEALAGKSYYKRHVAVAITNRYFHTCGEGACGANRGSSLGQGPAEVDGPWEIRRIDSKWYGGFWRRTARTHRQRHRFVWISF